MPDRQFREGKRTIKRRITLCTCTEHSRVHRICRIRSPSAAGSLECSSTSANDSLNTNDFPSDDSLSWLDDFKPLEDLVKDWFPNVEDEKECNKIFDEMVASASAFLEPIGSTLPSTSCGDLEAASCPLLQDTWNMAPEPIANVFSAHSVSETPSPQPLAVDENSRPSDNSEEVFEEMISEEIVITSEDLFLTDARCDGSECSEYDTDERNSDQGYESIDSPDSIVSENDTLSELFPNLM